MNETVKVNINVDSNGTTDKENKKAQNYKKTLDGISDSLSKISRSSTKTGSTAAVRSTYSGLTDAEYETGRGVAGVTGAGARDFAKQAQGLGGLVRLYATFAANIFAASAAFSALREAANTDNMIRGMDQLSARSGQSLGALAKSLAQVTDGAVSMRDAMEATTKASSAGLSSDQILKLGEVAKKASQTLGISMTDALSRLSRGISKLEPELLDELGLYTKLGKATEDYVRSVGKTATTLSDYEKRQAFANAVLKEGLDKFSSVDIPANPYDKLAAAMQNLSYAGLSLVNKVLGPIANMLAQSPTALATIIGGIATLLISKAIPAISQYREGLRQASLQAAAAAEGFKKSFGDQFQTKMEQMFKIPDLEAKVKALAKGVENVDKSIFKSKSSKAVLAAATSPQEEFQQLDKKTLGYYTGAISRTKNLLEEAKNGTKQLTEEQVKAAKTEMANMSKVIDMYHAKVELAEAHSKIEIEANKKQGALDPEKVAERKYVELRKAATRSEMVYEASSNAQVLGVRKAMTLLNKEIADKGITGFEKFRTQVTGGIAAVGSRITSIIGAFGAWGQAIGVVVSAGSLLYSWASKNSEQMAAFSDSLDRVEESGKLVDNVLKELAKSKAGEFSLQSIEAKANAFNTLASAAKDAVEKFKEAQKMSGWADDAVDFVKSWVGQGAQQQLAKGLSLSISKSLSLLEGEDKAKASANLKNILGLGQDASLELEDIAKAMKKLPESGLLEAQEQVEKYFSTFTTKGKSAIAAIKSINEGFSKLSVAAQGVQQSLNLSDPLSKFGQEMALQAVNISKVIKEAQTSADPKLAVAELKNILEDPDKLKLLPPEALQTLLSGKDSIETYAKSIEEASKTIEATKKAIGADNIALNEALKGNLTYGETFLAQSFTDAQNIVTGELRKSIEESEKKQAAAIKTQAEARIKITEILETGQKVVGSMLSTGLKIMERAAASARQLGGIAIRQGVLEGVAGPEAAAARGALVQEEIAVQKQQINATLQLSQNLLLNTLAVEKSTLERRRADLEGAEKTRGLSSAEKAELAALKGGLNGSPDVGLIQQIDAAQKRGVAGLSKIKPGSREFEELPAVAQNVVLQMNMQKQGAAASLATLDARGVQERNKTEITSMTEAANSKISLKQAELRNLTEQATAASESFGLSSLVSIERVNDNLKLQDEILKKQDEVRKATQDRDLDILEKRKQQAAPGEKPSIEAEIERTKARQKEENEAADIANRRALLKNAQDAEGLKLKSEEYELDRKQKMLDAGTSYSLAALDIEEQRLEIKKSMGLASEKEIDAFKETAALQKITLETSKNIGDIDAERSKALNAIRQKQTGLDVTSVDYKNLEQEKRDTEAFYTLRINNEYKLRDAKMANLYLDQSMSKEAKAAAEVVKQSFEKMTDAIVEWAKTGKFSIKDVFNTMIAELAKISIKKSMEGFYGGLDSLINQAVNFVFPKSTPSPDGITTTANRIGMHAKGSAWDGGVMRFAKGGSFTNSIVSNPTLFKFASGTGLMGEAGPEAIMPLKRDSTGNLGVRSTPAKVDVVVNNYGQEKAEVRETEDGNGNRQIEVVIGDVVAGELGRQGSKTQQAMYGIYGSKPRIPRR